jgi:hypothetical protein
MMALDFDCGVLATAVYLFGSLGITVWMGKTIETYGAGFLQDAYTEPEEEKAATIVIGITKMIYYFIAIGTILGRAANKYHCDSLYDGLLKGLGDVGGTMLGTGFLALVLWVCLAILRKHKKAEKQPKQPWE